MNAAFYTLRPRVVAPETTRANGPRAWRIHRWVAAAFTLAVTANFAAMPSGPPPAWITYAPLLPLMFLFGTGPVMLVSRWISAARQAERGEAQ